MKYILYSTLLLMGCASVFQPNEPIYIDSSFVPYVESYKQDKKTYLGYSYIKNISIIFKELKERDGTCTKYSDGKRIIHINPTAWNTGSDSYKLILLYHELGHCDLDLEHDIGDSIMSRFRLSEYFFNLDSEYYIKLLFTSSK